MTQLLDTNVWLALLLSGHPGHGAAQDWLGEHAREPGSLALCRATEQSLLRLLTTQKVLNSVGAEPLTNAQAIEEITRMRKHPTVAEHPEPADTRTIWFRFATRPSASPKLWMDAYLAAFAVAGKLRMVSFDKAFRQFQPHGLSVRLLS